MEPINQKMEEDPGRYLNFENTEIAFAHKSNKELKQAQRLFKLMNNNALVTLGSAVTPLALTLNLPFVKAIIQATIFKQFVGGVNLLDTQKSIDALYKHNTLTILDYGAESKTTEEDLDNVMKENIKAIELAASNSSVPVISTKVTGLASNDLLIKMQTDEALSQSEEDERKKLMYRIDQICKRAFDLGVGVMIDAEESWMQITIDNIVEEMMAAYNQEKVIVYNTFQLYRHDKLQHLKDSHAKAMNEGYMLGAKLVRGAYMDKENEYAEERGIPTVMNKTKEDTDRDYNAGVKFCVENYERIASVCATHNMYSNLYQAQLIEEMGIDKAHPHLNFCQLYGMSDNITFNLARAGFNVAKYVPYGPLKEVIPYLIRRAKENTSVTGDMSRELSFISDEIKRRGI